MHHTLESLARRGARLSEAICAVILVHGRGDSAEGILDLADVVSPNRDQAAIAYLAPEATGNTWYPNSFLAPLQQNEPGISSGVETLQNLVDMIMDSGIPTEKILVGGFSQGACLASEFVARNPARYGGLAILSGGLIGNGELPDAAPPDDKTFDYPGNLLGTPVFMGCSDVDAHIPLSRFEQSAEVLAGMGAEVNKKVYQGMGHTINEDEIQELKRLLSLLA
jgi:predicted esterase